MKKPNARPKTVAGFCLALCLPALAFAAPAQKPLIYGYLSRFPSQSQAASAAEVAWLNTYHINYVQFYDWQWKHHLPLAGTVADPAASWTDLSGRTIYRQTVLDLIDACHAHGMQAMNYNLLYGAATGYQTDGSGVSPTWGLFDAPGGSQWEITPFGSGIDLFNPANPDWQAYLFNKENDVFTAYPFDGWQVDQLGDPGGKYDAAGQAVDVWTTFAGFLANAQPATGKKIIFNNVGAYGMFSSINGTPIDAVYVECWPQAGQTTYNDLKTVIDHGLDWSGGKPVVLAAYMNYDKKSGSFNAPGVLLCDAVIFASGGTHLELGDGGHMLCSEYFPNVRLSLDADLAQTLAGYYDFIVAYQDWLYAGMANSANAIVLDIPSAPVATPQTVWAFAKVKDGKHLLNLINLTGESSIAWRDALGTYPAPTVQKNVTVKYYHGAGTVSSVALASPDIAGGAIANVTFTEGSDQTGNYIRFTVPALYYWDVIMIQTGASLTGLQAWRQTYFSTTDGTGASADAADPDGDGRSNLVEYATGTSPLVANAGPPAQSGLTTDRTRLTLSFNLIADPSLSYAVEATDDLASATWPEIIWTSTGAANTAGAVTVADVRRIADQPRRFLRLRVTL